MLAALYHAGIPYCSKSDEFSALCEMSMHVKLSSTLRKYVPGYDPENGISIALEGNDKISALDLAIRLGISLPEIKFAMINGHYQPLQTILQPDDRIAYFPAVGGG